ncbi:cyclin2 related protein [Cyclospora cayetanensis]|uniref:Cyclin2 related protein n=1 Tax=Cyclospora cayetanensis TaxID=88456 RepID=A0A1D3CRW2_9EIME|nr:cyclin2 related protein [Cyclospora cayetanensis]
MSVTTAGGAVALGGPSEAFDRCCSITTFHAISTPAITVSAYLQRVARYFGCSNECFVLALVYIDRILKRHPGFTVSLLNIHRLLLSAVAVAAKFYDDVYYSNRHYAKVGGVRTPELNLLEGQFLSLISFQLFVSTEEYDSEASPAEHPLSRDCPVQQQMQSQPFSSRSGAWRSDDGGSITNSTYPEKQQAAAVASATCGMHARPYLVTKQEEQEPLQPQQQQLYSSTFDEVAASADCTFSDDDQLVSAPTKRRGDGVCSSSSLRAAEACDGLPYVYTARDAAAAAVAAVSVAKKTSIGNCCLPIGTAKQCLSCSSGSSSCCSVLSPSMGHATGSTCSPPTQQQQQVQQHPDQFSALPGDAVPCTNKMREQRFLSMLQEQQLLLQQRLQRQQHLLQHQRLAIQQQQQLLLLLRQNNSSTNCAAFEAPLDLPQQQQQERPALKQKRMYLINRHSPQGIVVARKQEQQHKRGPESSTTPAVFS